MACYHPIPARQDGLNTDVTLWPPVGTANLELPCGTCLGCTTDRALDWARRCRHEASSWTHNCFLTLTYKPEEMPDNGALRPADLQKFLKRLRRTRDRCHPALLTSRAGNLRYLAAGEYGERTARPHYHLLLFNCDFSDSYAVAKNLRASPLVTQLWPAGEHRLGTLTGASAAYVAQYSVKKRGKTYASPDGEILPSPFIRASLKPAIGHTWINKNKEDLKLGYMIADGRKTKVPRAYKNALSRGSATDRQLAETIAARALQARKAPVGRTHRAELSAREQIHEARLRDHNLNPTL